jgi:hypothetical protein
MVELVQSDAEDVVRKALLRRAARDKRYKLPRTPPLVHPCHIARRSLSPCLAQTAASWPWSCATTTTSWP